MSRGSRTPGRPPSARGRTRTGRGFIQSSVKRPLDRGVRFDRYVRTAPYPTWRGKCLVTIGGAVMVRSKSIGATAVHWLLVVSLLPVSSEARSRTAAALPRYDIRVDV